MAVTIQYVIGDMPADDAIDEDLIKSIKLVLDGDYDGSRKYWIITKMMKSEPKFPCNLANYGDSPDTVLTNH